jgi:hypothetical protein
LMSMSFRSRVAWQIAQHNTRAVDFADANSYPRVDLPFSPT